MAYQVKIDLFEGPLDLLLYLVTREQMDVTAVSLAKVAEEYQAYLSMLEMLDLDIESSYLVAFACLLEIKSRILLPPEPEDFPPDLMDLDLEGDTAEQDLVERLKEYKKFKQAGRMLSEREREAMLVFPRPTPEEAETGESAPLPELDVSLPDLLDALRGLLEQQKARERNRRRLRVERVDVSVPQRMQEILEDLATRPSVTFYDLFEREVTRSEIIVTFLAILELARLRRIRMRQEGRHGPILVEARQPGDEEPLPLPVDEEALAARPRRRRRRSAPADRGADKPMEEPQGEVELE